MNVDPCIDAMTCAMKLQQGGGCKCHLIRSNILGAGPPTPAPAQAIIRRKHLQ